MLLRSRYDDHDYIDSLFSDDESDESDNDAYSSTPRYYEGAP